MTTSPTPPPTPSQLRALAEEALQRDKKATKGPWFQWKGHWGIFYGTPKTNTPGELHGHDGRICEIEDPWDKGVGGEFLREAKANTAFIIQARTSEPALARAVIALLNDAERDNALISAQAAELVTLREVARLAKDAISLLRRHGLGTYPETIALIHDLTPPATTEMIDRYEEGGGIHAD